MVAARAIVLIGGTFWPAAGRTIGRLLKTEEIREALR